MDKAKAKVSEFMSKSGEKDTTVHETVAPAVVKETVKPTRHEEQQVALDKEVHQDHYHTSVQPVRDQEILPEQHTHQVAGVEQRSFVHGAPEEDKARAAAEAAQFRDERYVSGTQHTTTQAPTIAGEHIHHHVHETIQPVVHKETIQPEVVHTTQPIHEIHQNAAIHHGTHQLPEVSKSELEAKGVSLAGREERYDSFKGEPKPIDGQPGATTSSSTGAYGTSGTTGTTGTSTYDTSRTTGTTGTTGTSTYDTSRTTGESGTYGVTSDSTTRAPGYEQTNTKPSLLDKINPKVDSTGDGQAGFMK